MTVQSQFAKGVAWMAAGNWTEQAINFAVFILLARLLGAESFGIIAMASIFVVFAEFLVRETFTEFLIARAEPQDGHYNAAFWLLLGVGLIITILLYLLAPLIANFFGETDVAPILRAMSVVVILTAVTEVPVAILRRDLSFRILSLRAIAGVVIGGAVGIGLALAGAGAWALAWQRISLVLVNIVMAWSAVNWRPGTGFNQQQAKDILNFGSQVQGMRAADLALTQVPVVAIGFAFGAHAVGLFSFAWRLVENAALLLSTPLRMVAQPAFAAAKRGGDDPADWLIKIVKISSFVTFPAFAGMSVLAGPLLIVVFGDKWLEAVPILSVLAVVGAYTCVEKIHLSFCLAEGRAGRITALAWAEVALAALIVGAAVWTGLLETTVTYVAVLLCVWIIRFNVVARVAMRPLSGIVSMHLMPTLCSILMALAVSTLTDLPAGLALLAGTFTGIIVYTLLSAVLMRDRFANFFDMLIVRKTTEGPPR